MAGPSLGWTMTGFDLARYLNVRHATRPSFAPDGTRLSFLVDTTGTDQVWSLAGPGGWPTQLTFAGERVTFAEWSPTRDELAFGMDAGGDERDQLYRLAGDGSTVTPLTAQPEAKHLWGAWSHDGERIAFTSNRRDDAVFDGYVQDRTATGDGVELVFEGDGWLSVLGWSPDDDRLVLHEARSSFDHELSLLDLASGTQDRLTSSDDPVRYEGVNWGPDGDALYLVTDEGADTAYLARLDLDSGDIDVVEDGGDWDVEGLVLDEATGRFVASQNVDGYAELTVGELTGTTSYRTFPTPDLPRGVVLGVEFAPSADRFAVAVAGRTTNGNVHVVDVATGEATRWTAASTAGIPRASFAEPTLVRYESFDGRAIPAFVTLPAAVPDGGAPVIVDVHGGPESQRRPGFHALAQYYAGRGYAVFEPNVRGSAGYGRAYTHLDDVERRMDSVADLAAGLDWLEDQPAVDASRAVAMGGSYGGFMVLAALTTYPDRWAAGVDIVGIANFVTFLEHTGAWRREHREAEYGSLADDRAFLESISPINHVDRLAALLFVAHGANDPRVPLGEAEQIVEQARERGVPVELLVFDDEGHGFTKRSNRLTAYAAIDDFLAEHVT